MRKRINFGRVTLQGYGNRTHPVYVEMEYRNKEGKENQKVLSICGTVGDVMGGQCIDSLLELPELANSPLLKEIHRLWESYHLNDMHPECEHQKELGWLELRSEKVSIYEYTITSEASSEQRRIKKEAMDKLMNGETVRIKKADRKFLAMDYSISLESEITTEHPLFNYYKHKTTHTKTLGWLSEKEHSRGILSKVCPVCGYKYGNAWNYVPVPEEDEKIILSILDGSHKLI